MPGVIFATILQMSYVASLCIIVVLAVRLLMKRAPRRFSYMLWMVVLFRLLCPVALSGAVSLLPAELFPQTLSDGQNKGSAAGNTSGDRDNRIDTGGSLGTSGTGLAGMEGPVVPGYQEDNVQLQMAEKENAGQGSNRYITSGGFLHGIENSLLSFMGKPGVPVSVFLPIGSAVWLAGLVLLILYSIIALLRLKQRLTGAVCLRENVLLADHIQTPFVLGLLRPRIYLPSTLGENEREYIILHEKEHIRHLDHVVKAVCFLAVMLHWFNPLAWLFFVLCTRDMEMACDESVMDGMKEDIRKDYSALLLNLASGRKIVNGAPLAFGEGDTKERIRNVLRYHKPAVWVSALAMMTVLGICVGLAVNPAGKSTDGEKSSEVAGGGTHKDEMVSGTVDIETGSGIEDGMSGSSAQNRSSDSGTEDSLSGSDTDHDGTGGTAADGAGSTDIGNSGKDFIPDNRAWPEGITVSADCKSLNQEQATALLGEAQELLTQYVEGRYTLISQRSSHKREAHRTGRWELPAVGSFLCIWRKYFRKLP